MHTYEQFSLSSATSAARVSCRLGQLRVPHGVPASPSVQTIIASVLRVKREPFAQAVEPSPATQGVPHTQLAPVLAHEGAPISPLSSHPLNRRSLR